MNSKSARVLVTLVVPGHLFFLYTIHLLQGGHTAMTPIFIICYLSAALLQVRLTDTSCLYSFKTLLKNDFFWNTSKYSHCPGGDFAVCGWFHGTMAVAKGTGPRQLLHPLPHSARWPVGDWLLGSELQTDTDGHFCWDWSLTPTYGPVHSECTLYILYMQVA